MTKQSFPIPEGCKAVTVEQVGNQIITTFEPIKNERWRAVMNEMYFCVSKDNFQVFRIYETHHYHDDSRFLSGNYFQTEEQAQRAADRLKTELDKFWEEEMK